MTGSQAGQLLILARYAGFAYQLYAAQCHKEAVRDGDGLEWLSSLIGAVHIHSILVAPHPFCDGAKQVSRCAELIHNSMDHLSFLVALWLFDFRLCLRCIHS